MVFSGILLGGSGDRNWTLRYEKTDFSELEDWLFSTGRFFRFLFIDLLFKFF